MLLRLQIEKYNYIWNDYFGTLRKCSVAALTIDHEVVEARWLVHLSS